MGHNLKSASNFDSPKEVIEVSDMEPEIYPASVYKCLCYKQEVYNVNPGGHQLRTNVSGRCQVYQTGRLSIWELRKTKESRAYKEFDTWLYEENKSFNIEHQIGALSELERAKLVESIDLFIKSNSYASNFVDVVTDDVAPDYLNVIPVEMNIYTIRDNIECSKYRSKEMLLFELKLIEQNCVEFNGSNSKITRESRQVHENLKRYFEKILTNRLRTVRRSRDKYTAPAKKREHQK